MTHQFGLQQLYALVTETDLISFVNIGVYNGVTRRKNITSVNTIYFKIHTPASH